MVTHGMKNVETSLTTLPLVHMCRTRACTKYCQIASRVSGFPAAFGTVITGQHVASTSNASGPWPKAAWAAQIIATGESRQARSLVPFRQVASDQSHPPAHRVQRGWAPQLHPAMQIIAPSKKPPHLTSVQDVVDVFQERPESRRNVRKQTQKPRAALSLVALEACFGSESGLFLPPDPWKHSLVRVALLQALSEHLSAVHIGHLYMNAYARVCLCMCVCVCMHVHV